MPMNNCSVPYAFAPEVSARRLSALKWWPVAAQQARCVLLASLLALLAACAGAPPPVVTEPGEQLSAEQAFAQGNYAEAARAWQRQALSSSGAEAAALRIRAADAWLLAGQVDLAEDNLRWVNKAELQGQERAALNLVLAELALLAERPEEAGILLREAAPDVPVDLFGRYEQLLARTERMLALPGSRDFSAAARLSESATTYVPEQALALIQSLDSIPSSDLAMRAASPQSDPQFAGWLELALIIRNNLVNPDGLAAAVGAWKTHHPTHLVEEQQALDLWLRYRQLFAPPRKVAVLLPTSGRLQAAADALRDGIMSAYMDNPAGAELVFIPTGEEAESAPSAYFEARERGAEWIIGPLQKQSIEALLNLAGLVTPMLALNELPADYAAPPGLAGQIYGLSLSQDEEVRAIARAAIRDGHRNAIVLAPGSEWGERMAQGFSDEFLREDRQILASSRYLESENDHSPELERLLLIDESKARRRSLENTLQMPLEFDPVRRDDVDMIFLAASATQGRLLRPQLRFHDAGDIPVYAPSRIFTGIPDRNRDQDLNGVRFPSTPLQLSMSSTRDLPALSSLRGGAFLALFALGQDAWNLLPWLDLMKRDPDFAFPGASGQYRTALQGELQREPAFAIFSGGRPAPYRRQQAATNSPP